MLISDNSFVILILVTLQSSFSSFTSSFFLSASSSSLTLLFSSSLSSCSFVIILICSFWTKSHWSWLNLGLFFVLVISSCHWVNSATSHKKIHLASKIYPKTYIFGKLNCTKYGCMAKNSLFWIWFNVFGRFEDANQLRTVAKYVAGRLIWTSLGHSQDSTVTFNAQYVACLSQHS